jgi:hypothetical protein
MAWFPRPCQSIPWRGTPTEFYWEDSPDQRTLIREVIVYDVNGDALRFIGQTPIDPSDETSGWDFRPAAGVYAELMVDGSPNRFVLRGGPPGAMRQPGGWVYRFEVSNRPSLGSPSIPDWGYGKKAMLRNKLEGVPEFGSVLRPAIESPYGHKWWIDWDIRSDQDMTIYVMDDQSKAILIFQRLSNDFGICCSGDLDAVNEKWPVSYRHPLRTGDVPIVLGYISSCGYVQYEAGVPYPKERTTVYWNGQYPHEQVATVSDMACFDSGERVSQEGGALGRNDLLEQQTTIFNWEPIQEREQLLYRAAYGGIIPENIKGRLKQVRLQGFRAAAYHHEYAGSDAHFVMQIGTTPKDTTQLDYFWDRGTGMFTTLTATRPAINAQLIDPQRRRWDRYEVTQYEFNTANGQVSRISRWLTD